MELKAEGYTDYLMIPLLFSDGSLNTLAIATKSRNELAPLNSGDCLNLSNSSRWDRTWVAYFLADSEP